MNEINSNVYNGYGQLDCLKVLFYMEDKDDVSELLSYCIDGATPLMVACKNGHLKIVQYLIQKCHVDIEEVGIVTIDHKKIEGVTPLWCAAASGHLSIVETLIEHKALVNSTTNTNSTPLRAACYEGNIQIVKYLIDNGADIQIANCQGQTCLMAACYKGHYAICDHLIKCGANVDEQDIYGNSALQICVKIGNVEMAKYLIKHGADVSCCMTNLSRLIYPCLSSTTPLITACKDGQLQFVKYLIQKCCVDVEEVGLFTVDDKKIEDAFPLWCAVAAGHLNIVKTLIEYKASVNRKAFESTPLHVACHFGHLEIVKYLIQNGADIDSLNYQRTTCLMAALQNGHNEIFKYLVECGANVNIQDEFGGTVLHMCVDLESLELTKYFFEHGANIEAANCCGETCLIIACEKGYNDISKYLLNIGANVNRKTLEGNTALHAYCISNNLEMVKLLYEKGAKLYENSYGTTPLLTAASKGHELMVDFIINNYEITKLEQINALELLGAAHVDEKKDMNAALAYWQQAMALRYESNKCPIEKFLTNSPLVSYLDANEVCTISQLTDLNASDSDELRKQSLLTRERILGDNHPDTIHWVMGVECDDAHIEKCIQLWIYALEVLQRDEEPFSFQTHKIFRVLARTFISMTGKIRLVISKGLVVFLFQSVLHVFQNIVKEFKRSFKMPNQKYLRNLSSFSDTIIIAVNCVGIFSKLLPHLNQFEIIKLKEAIYQFVCLNISMVNGFTPLHLACVEHPIFEPVYSIFKYPSLMIINLLLEAGANPNTINEDHNTPFHLAMKANCPVDVLNSLLKQFLKHGAHLDNRNLNNKAPLQIVRVIPSVAIYPLRHVNLQCLCAKTINTYKIPYKDKCPKTVEEFLFVHCTH